jgi:hypothetical protein
MEVRFTQGAFAKNTLIELFATHMSRLKFKSLEVLVAILSLTFEWITHGFP